MDGLAWNWFLSIFRKSVEKIQVTLNSDKHSRDFAIRPVYIFLSLLVWIWVTGEMFQTSFGENQNTHFMFNNVFWKSFRLWDHMEKHGRARQTADDNIRVIQHFACWVPKATDPHCERVILYAFPRQQCFRKLASVLHLFVYCLSWSLNIASLRLKFRTIISRAVF